MDRVNFLDISEKNKRLKWYFIIAFVPAWILQGIGSFCVVKNIGGEVTAQNIFSAFLAVCMYMPLLATVISAKFTGEKIGIKLHPKFKGHIRWYAAAWFLPAIFLALGDALYFLILRDNFDPELTMFHQTIRAAAESGQNVEGITPLTMLLLAVIASVTIAPAVNGIAAFGEEAGWRGYMTPALTGKFGRTKGLILSGVIWGAWHWPAIALAGFDFGTGYPFYPVPGLLAMCFACTAIGIALSYIYEKSDSILVPSIAHGAVNGFTGIGIVFLKPGITDMVLGPKLGFITVIPLAAVSAVLLCRCKIT